MNEIATSDLLAPQKGAGWRNMQLLIHLRWIAVTGQLATIAVVWLMGVKLPLAQLLLVPMLLAVYNVISWWLISTVNTINNAALMVALLVDVGALAWQLHYSGGGANPFTSLFLLQVVIGATLLTPRYSWVVASSAFAAMVFINIYSVPLDLPPPYNDAPQRLYLIGSFISFILVAFLLVIFIGRMTVNLRQRDATLAAVRQRAAEEDHIVRMGLLASGAAHELGTPLSLMSVLIGDWKRMPKLNEDPELTDDLDEMQRSVARCKAIVSGILMSAGDARGEAPEITTMRAFLEEIVEEWRDNRIPGTVEFEDAIDEDQPIVSDPALRQVIGNIIDNAAEVSPDWIGIRAAQDEDSLILEVSDDGPGFSPDILSTFGQPYRSTKGKPGGGLGLFLLVNVLRKLGGKASAHNRNEGGAMVRISLPLEAIAYRPGKKKSAKHKP
ncbi:sensor histidine kinase [Altererythrobacter indicus]|uniref:histidine kinase n=1 Tax=Altericroceibacterium indicum TaxID=374177 RepID=A0A845AE58_9SPHN|nr:ATP-binding protein [Altericroceibacterium indicum]MXP27085.1 sensor histidine kinase [Altericroceibacterium indicum]